MSPFLRLVGEDHQGSEMTGVVFDPSGTRMYFSSQRSYPLAPLPDGAPSEASVLAHGATYEVTGPFRLPPGGVPESWVYGPPAGERAGVPGLGDVPGLRLDSDAARLGAREGERLADRPAELHAVVRTFDLKRESRGDGTHERPLPDHARALERQRDRGKHQAVPGAVAARAVGRPDGRRRARRRHPASCRAEPEAELGSHMDTGSGERELFSGHPSLRAAPGFVLKGLLAAAVIGVIAQAGRRHRHGRGRRRHRSSGSSWPSGS